MARKITLMRESTGLNNVVDPSRLKVDLREGTCELAAAYNIDHDPSGRISRRRGFVQKRSEAAHSGFCDGGDCLYIAGTSLYRLNPDYSRTGLRSGLSDAPMAYVQVAGGIYYSNGFEKGYVPQGGPSQPWVAGEYTGPETRKLYHDPPAGHLLAFYDSCLLVAKGNTLYRSERFQYNWFRRYGFVETDRITLVQPVSGGLFVATAHKTFFYKGASLEEMQRKQVANYGVIEGTVTKLPASLLGLENFGAELAIWATPKGICVGGDGGFYKNLTETKLVYPAANRGCGIVKDNSYLVLLEE